MGAHREGMRNRTASLTSFAALIVAASAARAQAIGGRVVDDARGAALAHVRAWVRLPASDSIVTAESARDGTFILALPRPGRYRVHFLVDSIDVVSDSLDVNADDFIQKEFRLALGGHDSAAGNSLGDLAGVVVDSAGHPIAGVEVSVDGSARSARTDSSGAFRFTRLGVGPQLLRLRRIGLQARTIPLTVTAGWSPRLEIELTRAAQSLAEVSVRAPHAYAMLGGQTFEQRRKMGSGTFITPEQIERSKTTNAVDFLRGVRGFRVELDARTHQWRVVSSRGATSMSTGRLVCSPSLFVDGMGVGIDMINLLPPSNILAIEAYPGPADTPMEFGGTRATCGAIAVWTKTGALPESEETRRP